jgi:hypothetical protein
MKNLIVAMLCIPTCNQMIYDALYKQIVITAIKQGANAQSMQQRNQTITTLRQLCKGQKSSFEKHK